MQGSITRDPFARWVMQPLVDATGIDPVAASRFSAEMLAFATVTSVVTNVCTLDARLLPGLYVAETMHLLLGLALVWGLHRVAPMGPAVLALPNAWLHAFLRVVEWIKVAWHTRSLVLFLTSGVAHMLHVSIFRVTLTLSENLLTLAALYFGMCRKPPPSERTKRIRSALQN